jgi:hypothetical protein
VNEVRLNIVSTKGAGGVFVDGQIRSPELFERADGYAYDAGFLEFGNGTDGSLPFRVDQDGVVTAASIADIVPSGDTTGATDTAALNAALAVAGNSVLLKAGGVYYISAPLTPAADTVLDGVVGPSATAASLTAPTTIRATAAFSGTGMIVPGGDGCQIRNLLLDGSLIPSGTQYGINLLNGRSYGKVTDVEIIGDSTATNTGLTSGIRQNGSGGNPVGWRFTRVVVRYAAANGFLLVSGTDCDWHDCQAGSCVSNGWSINGCQNSRFIGCRANQNTNRGFLITGSGWGSVLGSGGATFVGCTTDSNAQSGFYVDSTGVHSHVFSGCIARRDGSDNNAARAGFLVTGATNPVILSGCSATTGLDDASTHDTPALGLSIVTSTLVVAEGCTFHGVTTAVSVSGAGQFQISDCIQITGATGSEAIVSPIPYNGASPYPTGALAETFPRQQAANNALTPVSTTAYFMNVKLKAGQRVNSMSIVTNTTGKTGGSHGWYALVGSDLKVKAVTVDQTDAATVWGVASTEYNLSFTAAYDVPLDDDYYLVFCVVATGVPTFTKAADLAGGIAGIAPKARGTAGTFATTPPALGDTLVLTAAGTNGFYGYVK